MLLKPTPRAIGKAITYLGLLLTGAGLIGFLGPYMSLRQSATTRAQVVSNEIGFRQPGVYAFRLQLKWSDVHGERRATITTPVRAASEEEARAAYRGKRFVPGEIYDFYGHPDDPDRLDPFKGYNLATFGKSIGFAAGGIALFLLGMSILRKVRLAPGRAESTGSAR